MWFSLLVLAWLAHDSPEKSFSGCVVVRAAGAQVEHKKHPNVGTGRASLKCREGR